MKSPVVVVDDMTGDCSAIRAAAEELAPYPPASQYYPGLRRIISAADEVASGYVDRLLTAAAPFIAGAFDCMHFSLVEASFSLVTTPPGALAPQQRAPHFDSPDPDYLAVLHYLHLPFPTGTAFFRQRSTGIERVDQHNLDRFVSMARSEAMLQQADAGYIDGNDRHFEEIARVDGVEDRLIIYQGSLLHSGIIPPCPTLSPNPREGRLTANFFVQLNRSTS